MTTKSPGREFPVRGLLLRFTGPRDGSENLSQVIRLGAVGPAGGDQQLVRLSGGVYLSIHLPDGGPAAGGAGAHLHRCVQRHGPGVVHRHGDGGGDDAALGGAGDAHAGIHQICHHAAVDHPPDVGHPGLGFVAQHQ